MKNVFSPWHSAFVALTMERWAFRMPRSSRGWNALFRDDNYGGPSVSFRPLHPLPSSLFVPFVHEVRALYPAAVLFRKKPLCRSFSGSGQQDEKRKGETEMCVLLSHTHFAVSTRRMSKSWVNFGEGSRGHSQAKRIYRRASSRRGGPQLISRQTDLKVELRLGDPRGEAAWESLEPREMYRF